MRGVEKKKRRGEYVGLSGFVLCVRACVCVKFDSVSKKKKILT